MSQKDYKDPRAFLIIEPGGGEAEQFVEVKLGSYIISVDDAWADSLNIELCGKCSTMISTPGWVVELLDLKIEEESTVKRERRAILNRATQLALAEAKRIKNNAAWSGSRGDGGAGEIRSAVDALDAGLNVTPPMGLMRKYYDQAKDEHDQAKRRREDPEFDQYMKLKARYEGKG